MNSGKSATKSYQGQKGWTQSSLEKEIQLENSILLKKPIFKIIRNGNKTRQSDFKMPTSDWENLGDSKFNRLLCNFGRGKKIFLDKTAEEFLLSEIFIPSNMQVFESVDDHTHIQEGRKFDVPTILPNENVKCGPMILDEAYSTDLEKKEEFQSLVINIDYNESMWEKQG